MRILILGNNYSGKAFLNYLKEDKENTVFSDSNEYDYKVNFSDFNDIAEFCEANEINIVIPTEEKYVSDVLEKKLNNLNTIYFAPNEEAFEICRYKSLAKRFMYKNKIQTPKFFISEKLQTSYDYLKTAYYPIAIHPDKKSYVEGVKFAETLNQAQKYVNLLYDSGNRKIVFEDYIEGRNFIFWTISDGYSAKVIGICAKYEDSVSYFEPQFLNEEIKKEVIENIINPTILNLSLENTEYVGILGFDVIVNTDNTSYLMGYKGFFDDISVDFFLKGFDINWLDVFESCIKGDIFLKYDFKHDNEYMLTLRQNDRIETISANTKTNLERYIKELDIDDTEYKEAKRIWKYLQ